MDNLEKRMSGLPASYKSLRSQRGFFDFRILTLPLILGGVVLFVLVERHNKELDTQLMQEVLSIANGEDSTLSLDESIRMARELGYNGPVYTQYTLSFTSSMRDKSGFF